ncbi:MAG: cation-translocating P-type ATPase [Firmicutes bacterium]|nr:cation-translocating P-type ATPase [Bacillota bacterium]
MFRGDVMRDWYEKDRADLLREFGTDPETGLSAASVAERRLKYGKNEFAEQKGEGVGKKILRNLRDVSALILIFAAVMSLVMGLAHGGGFAEFAVIMGIVVLNMALAVTQERSAEKSLAALKNMNSPSCLALRDGRRETVGSAELVPGDILILNTGDLVAADARLLEAGGLAADESALTGESEPSEKNAEAALSGSVPAADQINMVFSGCLITAGRGRALVTATGMDTQIGRIAGFLNDAQKLRTPLQARLDKVGKIISLIAVISALVVFLIDFLRGADLWGTVFIAISLAVAAVPETLSLIVTLALARGVTEMAGRRALIRKLPAVETLGSTSVICTDKTGTLTQNRMAVRRLWTEEAGVFGEGGDFSAEQAEFLSKFALASNAGVETLPDGSARITGSPTEAAIMRLFGEKGGDRRELEIIYPRVAEIPFSSERKMMTAICRDPRGGYLVLCSGAFDRVPFKEAPPERKKAREEMHDTFAGDALRVIALGSRHLDGLPEAGNLGEAERELDFEGIAGIIDPPRPEAAEAVATAKKAGIRTVMITGDHAVTAEAIARQIGILSEGERVLTGAGLARMSDAELVGNAAGYSVYARVSPEDKIRIVEAWQERGEVVAMTGDGVNDAPALKAADVGVAMGAAGTEVAKSASDMILTDDNFSTIVEAVRQGRDVYLNIRKTVYFLLVCNFSEIAIMLGAQLIGWGLPLTPIMLLLINVLGDGIPGIRLAYEKSGQTVMERRPVGRGESLFEGLGLVIAVQTAAFVAVAWAGYYIGAFAGVSASRPAAHVVGQTMSFLVVGWTSILHVFTVRSRRSAFGKGFADNPGLALSAAGMIALFALIVLIPPAAGFFGMSAMGWEQWGAAIGLSAVPTVVAEIGKAARNRGEARRYGKRVVRHIAQE